MTVALTVTFQGRGLLLTISVTYVVIPGVPGPPFLLIYFSTLRAPSTGLLVTKKSVWPECDRQESIPVTFCHLESHRPLVAFETGPTR